MDEAATAVKSGHRNWLRFEPAPPEHVHNENYRTTSNLKKSIPDHMDSDWRHATLARGFPTAKQRNNSSL